jgi:hypothetical protein
MGLGEEPVQGLVAALQRLVLPRQRVDLGAHAELLGHQARDLLLRGGPSGRPGRFFGQIGGFPVCVVALVGRLFHAFTP